MISSVLKIIRPVNFLITFASVFIAGIICIHDEYSLLNIILASISAAMVSAGGNVINDYFDVEIDRINRPGRVLVMNLISRNQAVYLYVIIVSFSLLLSAFIGLAAFIIVIIANVTIYLYSFRLKKIPLLGNVIVSFFTGLAFIYGGVAVDNWKYGIIPAVFAFFTNMIRELIKDIEDIEGDSANFVFTFPKVYGITATIYLVRSLTLILIILTTVPVILGIYRIEYFLIVMPLVNGIFVFMMRSLKNDQSVKNLHKLSGIVKLNMVFGLIAIYMGNM